MRHNISRTYDLTNDRSLLRVGLYNAGPSNIGYFRAFQTYWNHNLYQVAHNA